MANYVPYHVHTMLSNAVTNIDSVTTYKQYIEKAKACGMTAMAFSEHGNIFEWVHKKDAWLYKNKEIYPEEYQNRLYTDDILEDMEFIEFTDKNNGFLELIDFLNHQLWFSYTSDIHKYRIVYYFDT